jgi:anti-sigma factor ChrR (cupin superfamily)
MITGRQEEQASLYALGALEQREEEAFEAEVRVNAELSEFVRSLQRTAAEMARAEGAMPSLGLKAKVLQRIATETAITTENFDSHVALTGQYLVAHDATDWKALPIPGAWFKTLSIDRDRGYVILLGKLDAGVRYPAHTHEGFENLYILTGDLHVGSENLGPGDFHHSDAGTSHPDNHSVAGCTLLAVLSTDHALAKFALAAT